MKGHYGAKLVVGGEGSRGHGCPRQGRQKELGRIRVEG